MPYYKKVYTKEEQLAHYTKKLKELTGQEPTKMVGWDEGLAKQFFERQQAENNAMNQKLELILEYLRNSNVRKGA